MHSRALRGRLCGAALTQVSLDAPLKGAKLTIIVTAHRLFSKAAPGGQPYALVVQGDFKGELKQPKARKKA